MNLNDNGNEYNGCVSVRYNSLFISLLFTNKRSQNDNVKKPHSAYSKERELYNVQFLKYSFSNFNAALRILFGIFLTV